MKFLYLLLVSIMLIFNFTFLDFFMPTVAQASDNTEFKVNPDGLVTITGGKYQSLNETDNTKIINSVLQKYKMIAVVITGFCTITVFLFLILMFTKLSVAVDDSNKRKIAIGGILTTCIAIALLGSSTIIIGFFYSAFKG